MRVHRAIAFIDLCGFSAFTERHRDDEVVLVLAELRAGLRQAAARRGVRVVKWLGDGAMVTSTSTEALVALLVEIDHRMSVAVPSLAVRAGIDEGPVIMFEGDDYIGTCVNIAARLCDQAGAHEIIATTSVLASRPPWVSTDAAGVAQIRGITDRLEVHRLILSPDGTTTDPICGLPLSPTHGLPAIGNPTDAFCSHACADTWTQIALLDTRLAPTHPSRDGTDSGHPPDAFP